jgi:hypothetical protein
VADTQQKATLVLDMAVLVDGYSRQYICLLVLTAFRLDLAVEQAEMVVLLESSTGSVLLVVVMVVMELLNDLTWALALTELLVVVLVTHTRLDTAHQGTEHQVWDLMVPLMVVVDKVLQPVVELVVLQKIIHLGLVKLLEQLIMVLVVVVLQLVLALLVLELVMQASFM